MELSQKNILDVYPLSPMQEGIYFHVQENKDLQAYFDQISFIIDGTFETDLFQRSFEELVNRHDILRTVFIQKEGKKVYQVVLKERKVELFFHNVIDSKNTNGLIDEIKQKDKFRSFQLDKDLLVRVNVIETDNNRYEIIWSIHHIITDGWSINLLFDELFTIYNSLLSKTDISLSVPEKYKVYIDWLYKQDKEEGLNFWGKYLEDFDNEIQVPTSSIVKLNDDSYKYNEESITIISETYERLVNLASETGVTLNALFQSLWAVLLGFYNDVDDVVFGKVVSGRPTDIRQVNNIIGIFINTIPIRIRFTSGDKLLDIVKRAHRDTVINNKYQYLPLAEIQSNNRSNRNLINHIYIYENYPQARLELNNNYKFRVRRSESFTRSHYNFNILVNEYSDTITIKIKYNANVYLKDFVANILQHLENSCKQLIANPEFTVKDLSVLSQDEKKELIYKFNDTQKGQIKDSVKRLIEKAIVRHPNNIAVKYEDKLITYKELGERSNQLAHHLIKSGIQAQEVVALMFEPSIEMIISILGVIKSCAVFLPIDLDLPENRKQYILKDSGSKTLLVSQKNSTKKIQGVNTIVVNNESTSGERMNNVDIEPYPESIVYCIYTSGTTGRPKGVLIENRNLVNYVGWISNKISLSKSGRCILTSSFAYDLGYTSVFPSLVCNSQLHLLNKNKLLSGVVLMDYLQNNLITCLKITPSLLSMILDSDFKNSAFNSVKTILIGGERINLNDVAVLYTINKNLTLINHYGPTEATIGCISKSLSNTDTKKASIVIGSPINNSNALVLNSDGKLVPIGIQGELHIGGNGLARGYLNNPELTRDKFIDNPYCKSSLIYNTGDIVERNHKGEIEFIGRKDNQIKIRGYRIEIAEIERVLLGMDNISDAKVICIEKDNHKQLAAYLVTKSNLKIAEVKKYASDYLPAYMLPTHYITIDELPLTPNKKLDISRLPVPEREKLNETIRSANRLEKELIEIWSQVLNIKSEGININSDFFEIGGHSLKITSVITLIQKRLEVKVPVSAFFQNSILCELSEYVKQQKKDRLIPIVKVEKKEYYPLSSSQKRVYFIQQMDKQNPAYNIISVLKIVGKIDLERLKDCIETIINRHESLRTYFIENGGIPYMVINPVNCQSCLEIFYKVNKNNIEEYIEGLNRSFNLKKAPLIKFNLLETDKDEWILMINRHHIVSDGLSSKILTEELTKLYNRNSVHKLQFQYRDYAEWQNRLMKDGHLDRQREYWLSEFSGKIPKLNLPVDYQRPPIKDNKGNKLILKISDDIYRRIKHDIRKEKMTLYMYLLSTYYVLLSKLCNQRDIVIGTALAGRKHTDLNSMIGMFVNMLPIRNSIPENISFQKFLGLTKSKIINTFENQDYQFEDIINDIQLNRDLSRNPLFDVIFALNNIDIEEANVSDIEISSYTFDSKTSKYDLTFQFEEQETNLVLTIEYSTKLFKRSTIERYFQYYNEVLCQLAGNPQMIIEDIEIIPESERKQILIDFNNTDVQIPNNKSVDRLFYEVVQKHPNRIAFVEGSKQVTYSFLNDQVNRLANYIRRQDVKSQSIVAITGQQGIELIIGILSIIRNGSIFLPLSPSTPISRINYILQESNVSHLLVTRSIFKETPFTTLNNYSESADEVKTAPRRAIADFNSIPIPNRSLVNYEKYSKYIGLTMFKNVFSIQASRGCPYNCSYCHKIWTKSHVYRSAKHIYDEISLYYNIGVKRFAFIDDVFNLNKANCIELFNLIINNSLDIQLFFPNGFRGDILDKDFIDLSIKAGTVNISLSLESASDRIQNLIEKRLKLDKLKSIINYIVSRYPEIILELQSMIGFPSETEEEAKMTIDFIKSIKWIHFPYLHILKIYPNTEMEDVALKNGVSSQSIEDSIKLAYHMLPETLPFSKDFALELQTDFLNNYFLLKERLLHLLPYQLKILSEDELIQKYNSYLSVEISCFDELLDFVGIKRDELAFNPVKLSGNFATDLLNEKLVKLYKKENPEKDATKILLLDLSQNFNESKQRLYNVVEPPLGPMYLATYLEHKLGGQVDCLIKKSYIDFNSYSELYKLLNEFKPDMIGIRSLSYFKELFHETIAMIRQWGLKIPIIAGGPYATSSYSSVVQDKNIDIVILGEGEITFFDIVNRYIKNEKRFPSNEELKTVNGIVFNPNRNSKKEKQREIVVIENALESSEKEICDESKISTDGNDLCYNIYTSGSTGRPKGVLINHKSLVNLCYWHNETFNVSEQDIATKYAGIGFDASVWEIFPYLLKGASIHIVDEKIKLKIAQLQDYFLSRNISISFLPTQICEQFINRDNNTLRYLLTGGDKLSKFKSNSYKLYNNYGPTEDTVVALSCPVHNDFENIPIGKPIHNQKIFILNPLDNSLCPIGVVGEIFIAGVGLSPGYLNSPDKTEERFSVNPFDKNSTVYSTGDIGRWTEKGDIEFMGRADQQVKVSGIRIELGEIEYFVKKFETVKDAVLINKQNSKDETYLCLFIIGDDKINVQDLRQFLSKNLPEYMIPAGIFQIDAIPITDNGKVDRKKLTELKIDEDIYPLQREARSDKEKKLIEIWKLLLNKEDINVSDNFFMLGGDSIKSIQLVSLLREYSYKLDTKTIFKYPVLRDLSSKLELIKSNQTDPKDTNGVFSTSPIQSWFFENTNVELQNHFNQSVMIFSAEGFSEKIVELVVRKLFEYHDSLRITFDVTSSEIHQIIHKRDEILPYFESVDYSNDSNQFDKLNTKVNELQKSIDIAAGPLMKVALLKLNDGHRLIFVIHHLIIDGVSWRILLNDFQRLYESYKNTGEFVKLPDTASYKAWVESLSKYSNSPGFLASEFAFWKNILSNKSGIIKRDSEYQSNLLKDVNKVTFTLSKKYTKLLVSEANYPYNTNVQELLVAAVYMSIRDIFNVNKLYFNVEGHGRETELTEVEISRTLGWFTTIYPVYFEISDIARLSIIVKGIKESFRKIPNKGLGFGLLKYLTDKELLEDELPESEAQVSFNYLGQFSLRQDNHLFKIAKESSGQQQSQDRTRDVDLDIFSIIKDHKLVFTINYNKFHFENERIELFSETIKNHLSKIITHCAEQKERELTSSDCTYKDITIEELNTLQQRYKVVDVFPLSPMQEGMLFHSILDTSSSAYFEQISYNITGNIEIDIVKSVLAELSERYEILRTAFVSDNVNRPLQVVLNTNTIPVNYINLEDIEGEDQLSEINKYKDQDKKNLFHLDDDPLIRLSILKLAEEEYKFIWSFHHIIMDGWCMGIIHYDFLGTYYKYKCDITFTLPETVHYKEYIKWIEQQDRAEVTKFWENYLSGFNIPSNIYLRQFLKNDKKGYINRDYKFNLSPHSSKALLHLASSNGITVNIIIQSIWSILLSQINNTEDIVYGTVVSGRPEELDGIEKMVGLFINTLPVRYRVNRESKFKEYISMAQQKATLLNSYHHYPLAEIQEKSDLKENLFDHILVFENYPDGSDLFINTNENDDFAYKLNFHLQNVEIFEQTSYDFNLLVGSSETDVKFYIKYNSNRFEKSYIAGIRSSIERIVDQVVANEDILLKNITNISVQEKEELIYKFNCTDKQISLEKTLFAIFKEQTLQTPNNSALIINDNIVTYHYLLNLVEKTSFNFKKHGIKKGDLVGVIMSRSIEMISALYGILKLGAVYVPIEPELPESRIVQILNSINLGFIITDDKELSKVNEIRNRLLNQCYLLYFTTNGVKTHKSINCGTKQIDFTLNGDYYGNIPDEARYDDLAYVIFTSGSTGVPKGVAVKHKPVLNLIDWVNTTYDISEKDRLLFIASVSFDLSVYDIFGILSTGGSIFIVPNEDVKKPDKITNLIYQQGITFWDSAPAVLQQLIPFIEMDYIGLKETLRLIFLSGDWIPTWMPGKLKEAFKNGDFIALGGATEATIWSNYFHVKEVGERWVSIPYGRPIQNAKYYVLDKNLNPQPAGIPGNLYIGGECLATAYLNDCELTSSKFIKNPFVDSGKIYKTGDVARFIDKHTIEFLGRNDSQVKIRGYRIELGEIESWINKIPGVDNSIVEIKENKDGEKFLVAYIICGKEIDSISKELVSSSLRWRLPDYMIPSHIMELKEIPVTSNGKVNRNALPHPAIDAYAIEKGSEKNFGYTEKKLLGIWSETLSLPLEGLSINANFFEIGGHSLKAVTIVSKIKALFGIVVSLEEVFKYSTIKELARHIKTKDRAKLLSLKHTDKKEYYRLSSAQRRLYYLNLLDERKDIYNIPLKLRIHSKLNRVKLEQSFKILLLRHELLRSNIAIINDEPVFQIKQDINFELTFTSISENEVAEYIRHFSNPFDLEKDPLFRIEILEIGDNESILLMEMHHIIGDAVSLEILFEDLIAIYNGIKLPELEFQYKDYAEWESSKTMISSLNLQKKFWLKEFKNGIPSIKLPADLSGKSGDYSGDTVTMTIDKQKTAELRSYAKNNEATIYVLFLSFYYLLIHKHTSQDEIVIATPVAGRNHKGLERIIGMFVNILFVKYRISDVSYDSFLKDLSRKIYQCIDNQSFKAEDLISSIYSQKQQTEDIVNIVFTYTNKRIKYNSDVLVEPVKNENTISKYDLTLNIVETDDFIDCVFSYKTCLFRKNTIHFFKDHFNSIISQVLINNKLSIKDLRFCAEDRVDKLFAGFSDDLEM